MKKDDLIGIPFFGITEVLSFKENFYHKQEHNKKGKTNQNLEIPFVE
jgi:hypothetical protein